MRRKESPPNLPVPERVNRNFHASKIFSTGPPGLGFFGAALLESEMILIVLDNPDRDDTPCFREKGLEFRFGGLGKEGWLRKFSCSYFLL